MATLTIYKAHSVREGTAAVLKTLKEGTGKNYVVVPDAYTLAFEAGALSRLGKEGSFDLEVVSFARLASLALGNRIKKCLSPAGSVMLLEKVIRAKEGDLRAYACAARKPGFAEEMYAALTAIRNSGISAEKLEKAAEGIGGYVKEKTLDVAALYKAYLETLALHYSDSTTRLEALIAEIENEKLFGSENFYVLDHTDLNAKQLGVLRALMKNARSLTVAVSVPMGGANKRVYPHAYFDLLSIAKEENVCVKEIDVPCSLSAAGVMIAENLFAYGSNKGKMGAFTLVKAKDEEEEATYVATKITELVRSGKARYRDVAVIAPDFERYRPSLELAFEERNIPYFSDERIPLDRADAFRHWIAAFEVCAKKADRNATFRYVFHELFRGGRKTRVTEEDKIAFYDYALKYGVQYFRSPFTAGADDPLFPSAEKVRALLNQELSPLFSLPVRAKIGAFAEAFERYLKENDFDELLSAYDEALLDFQGADQAEDEKGFAKESEILRQTPTKTMELLNALREIRGEDEVSFEDFILAFRSGASQVKIAALPVSLDCVYFASLEQAMFEPIDHLFILGAEDGAFPSESAKEGILGEREYATWRGQDLVVENVGADELRQNRFRAIQLLLRANHTTLSLVDSGEISSCVRFLAETFLLEKGKDPEKDLKEAFLAAGDAIRAFPYPYRIPTRAVAERFLVETFRKFTENTCEKEEIEFAKHLAEKMGIAFPIPAFDAEQKSLSRGPNVRKISVSELEDYFSCPFKHFVEYELGAKEKDVAQSDAAVLGIVLHEVAEKFMRWLTGEKKVTTSGTCKDATEITGGGEGEGARAVTDDEAREKGESLAKIILNEQKYQAIARAEGERFLDRMVRASGDLALKLKKQREDSSFVPKTFEAFFDEKGELPGLPLGNATLLGKIDRIDLSGDYAVAIDYKSGKSDYDQKDVYYGKKIQLQMYLAVLENAGYKPTAALYADIKTGYKKSGERFLKGQVLNEPWVATSLDQKIATGEGTWTGISLKKDKLSAKAADATLLTKEQMADVLTYVKALSEGAIREIEEGCVAPYPLLKSFSVHSHPCEYCPASGACLRAFRHKRVMKGKVTIDKFGAFTGKEKV